MIFSKFWKSEAELRKERSIKAMKDLDIPFTSWLPPIESSKTSLRRSSLEVAYRAMALSVVAVKGEGLEQKTVDKIIADYGLVDAFTPKEKEFIYSNEVDEVARIQFSWRYEAYWILLWALGFVEKLDYPDQTCDPALAVAFLSKTTAAEFIKNAKLRNQYEILDQADLTYRYHWAVRDNRLRGLVIPTNLNSSVVYERHYTLNWLIGYERAEWDDISTDT